MKKVKMLLLVIATSLLLSYIFVVIVSKKMNNKILKYSKVEAKRFANTIINVSTNEVINKTKISKDLLSVQKNNSNEIEEVNFNTANVNKLLKTLTENIQEKLLRVEEGNVSGIMISSSLRGKHFDKVKKGVVCEIPSGSIFGNSLLANTGPLLPVKLSFIGKVYTKAKTTIKTYGINSAYIELDIEVIITERISLPNLTEDIDVSKTIPIVMKIIQGKIPEYYNSDNYSNSKDYTLPLDE